MQSDTLFEFGGTSRYVLERELGQGSTGTVYQALDKERGARVALKALKKSDAINIYRLKKEFRQLADISHPNLVTLHELVGEDDHWFFTMELIEGTTLDRYVGTETHESGYPTATSQTSLRPPTCAAAPTQDNHVASSAPALPKLPCDLPRLRHVLGQLARAVAALHDAGKLHRDLKPSNILVTSDGHVVVLDFGLVSDSIVVEAEKNAEQTVGGHVFGTPAYMSPEQAAGESVTTASDWYSLGAVLYECLTGQLPFDGTVLDILRRKDEEEPLPPSALVSGVPDDLDQLCQSLLRRVPQERPTSAEVLRVLTGSSSLARVLSATAPAMSQPHTELFVGRHQHLQVLEQALASVQRNKPVAVLVHGPSGMGKSALTRCFANDLTMEGRAVVLRGRCYERESVPYKAFDNVIDSLSRYMMQLPMEQAAELLPRNVHSVARLFPVLRRVRAIAQARSPQHMTEDVRELRSQGFAALKDLLLRMSDFQPLVIQIDDLQWADADSARLLLHLLDPPEAPSLLFVGVYREGEVENSPFLRHVLGEGGIRSDHVRVVELNMAPLSRREAEDLAKELLRDYPTTNALLAHTIAAEAEGVPYFIGELVEHVRAQSQNAPIAVGSISLEDVIAERVARLPAAARRLLQMLSVAAGPLEQGIAMQAAGLLPSDRGTLLALRAARLVRTRGTRQTDYAETYHDRVRETVVSGMQPDSIRDCHARIAEAIEAWGIGDAERLVQHYSEAGDGVRAGETAVQAARAAAEQLAFNRAAQLYEKAIPLFDESNPQIQSLYTALAGALANAGRSGAAADAYLRAADMTPGEAQQELRRLATQQYLRSGRTEEGSALTAEILGEVGLSLPKNSRAAMVSLLQSKVRTAFLSRPKELRPLSDVPPALAARLDTLGSICQEIAASDPVRGALLRAQFLECAIRAREPRRLVEALAWQAVQLSVLGKPRHLAQADASLAWTREILSQYPSDEGMALLYLAQAARELFSGHFADAMHWARKADDMFRADRVGRFWERRFASLLRNLCMEFTGDLKPLTQEASQRLRDIADRDDRLVNGPLTLSIVYAHLMSDDPKAALRFLDDQAAHLTADRFTTMHHLIALRTMDTHLYARRGKAAWECSLQATSALHAAHLHRSRFVHAYFTFYSVRALLGGHMESGDPALLAQAKRHLQTLRKLDAGFAGYASALDATIAHRERRSEEAIVSTRRAMEQLTAPSDRRMLYAKHRLGTLIGGDNGQEHIAAASTLLRQQGITNPERWVAMMLGEVSNIS